MLAEVANAEGPFVPGVWRLGWLVLMQPIKLHGKFKSWGLGENPRLARLWPRVKARDPVVLALLRGWAVWLFVIMPILSVVRLAAVWAFSTAFGVPFSWPLTVVYGVTCYVAVAMALGVAGGIALAIADGVADLVVVGVAGAMALAIAGGVAAVAASALVLGTARFVAGCVTFGVAVGVEQSVVKGMAFSGAGVVTFCLMAGMSGLVVGALLGVAVGVAVGVVTLLVLFRLPLWPVEAFRTLLLSQRARQQPGFVVRLSQRLPFRHHDLLALPLPGLRSFLFQLAEADVTVGKAVIAEAAASAGQKRPARLTLVELQARDLEKAVIGRLFARVVDGDFPFLPKIDSASTDKALAPLLAFESAARDLLAGGDTQRGRGLALERARKTLDSFRTSTALKRSPDSLAQRLSTTAGLWLDFIHAEQHKLALDVAENPEIPRAFIAGPVLAPDEPENRPLFKGRDAIIKLIEHDLAPDRRGVLLVTGQRRMGKSSLRNYLPTSLGTGTLVLLVDFQLLSGEAERANPHLRLLAAIAKALPDAPAPPITPRWTDALRYLQVLDGTLTGRSLLLVIDEVERVEDGIRAGWCTTDFLDFVRAAGDCLRRIRLLLLTAYPLDRLGPHWVDRLISVTSRTISYLEEPDARELMVHPIPGFPDIYPPGGVDRILAMTGRHPYLLQKVGDELCRLLNTAHRQKATGDDLQKVFDGVINDEDLFGELWNQRTPEERASLLRMTAAGEPVEPDAASQALVRERYVERREGKVVITVPLFREWIRDTKGG
jgi:uncharacterized protein